MLNSCGIKCTHEQIFTTMGWRHALNMIKQRRMNPAWDWQAESSWLATPFLMERELYPFTVVHLVRHPRLVMESKLRLMFYSHPRYGSYFNWMVPFLSGINEFEKPVDKAAFWYIKLNEMVAERADIFHRVEDDVRDLLDKLGVQWRGKDLFKNTSYNTRPGYGPATVEIGDVNVALRSLLLEMAGEYGYTWK